MQAKMRSLLRLLVKSIIENTERQADATAAREAHHSAYSAADPSVHNTQDTLKAGTDTHAHSHTHTNRELQGMANLHQETEFSIFTATVGHIYIFFFPVKRQSEM